MIHQLNIYGKDKVDTAIDTLRFFEQKEGYYLAFSGGKDSVVIKALADMAGVKYDAHYAVTSVDPPELVRFVKTFPDVKWEHQFDEDGRPYTMWNLIVKKQFPPIRIARFCCEYLKEPGGQGRITVTGVRWDESNNRKANHGRVTIMEKKTTDHKSFSRTNRGGGGTERRRCTDHAEQRQRRIKGGRGLLYQTAENGGKSYNRLGRERCVGVHP